MYLAPVDVFLKDRALFRKRGVKRELGRAEVALICTTAVLYDELQIQATQACASITAAWAPSLPLDIELRKRVFLSNTADFRFDHGAEIMRHTNSEAHGNGENVCFPVVGMAISVRL